MAGRRGSVPLLLVLTPVAVAVYGSLAQEYVPGGDRDRALAQVAGALLVAGAVWAVIALVNKRCREHRRPRAESESSGRTAGRACDAPTEGTWKVSTGSLPDAVVGPYVRNSLPEGWPPKRVELRRAAMEAMGWAYTDELEEIRTQLRRADRLDKQRSRELLRHVDLSEADLSGADLSELRLQGANLIGAKLCCANLSLAVLCMANLSESDLRSALLCLADLSWAHLNWADLTGADLCGAKLFGADLRWGNLTGANLAAADLREADLSRAHLPGGKLKSARLWGANLGGANLYCADLVGANLSAVNLDGAYLRGADLTGALITGARLNGTMLYRATLPDGTQWSPETDMARFTDPKHPRFWGWHD